MSLLATHPSHSSRGKEDVDMYSLISYQFGVSRVDGGGSMCNNLIHSIWLWVSGWSLVTVQAKISCLPVMSYL